MHSAHFQFDAAGARNREAESDHGITIDEICAPEILDDLGGRFAGLRVANVIGELKTLDHGAISERSDLTLAQKDQVWHVIGPFFKLKPQAESVTPPSDSV